MKYEDAKKRLSERKAWTTSEIIEILHSSQDRMEEDTIPVKDIGGEH